MMPNKAIQLNSMNKVTGLGKVEKKGKKGDLTE
jgi:hypothetical protein